VSTFVSRLYQMAKEYAAARAGWGVLLVASFSMNRFPIRARALAASRSDVMKKIVIGIAVSAAPLGAGALAADLEVKAPPAIPYSVWSGPYLGISGGARFNAVDGNVTSATVGTPPNSIWLPPVIPGPNNWRPGAMQFIDNIAFRPGVYGGWTFQVTPSYIIGLEADFAYVKETSVFHGSAYPTNLLFGSPELPFGASPNDQFRVTTTWDGSVRLRGGWLATPSMLIYFTAGVAFARIEATSTCSTVPKTPNVSNCVPGNYFSGTLGPDVITHSGTQVGWTAGFGAETLLAGHWIARAQYRFSDFGYPSNRFSAFSATDVRTCTGCPSAASSPLTISYELPVMQHIFEFGIAYKFGP
jgi:outer membrane immunogenic protein